MEFEKLLELIDIVEKSSLSKFSYKEGDTEIKFEKKNENQLTIKTNSDNFLELEREGNTLQDDKFDYIKSPLIGTFYKSPSPNEAPFISMGDKLSKGQTIGIIEAMKVMNEVKCNYDAIVEEILVDDSENVEYGQCLVKIKLI